MRFAWYALLIAQAGASLSGPLDAIAQDRSPLFGGASAGFAFVDKQDFAASSTGFQAAGYLGRRLSSQVAGLAQLTLTTVSKEAVFPPAPAACALPGCSISPSVDDDLIGIALTPGVQLSRTTRNQKLALTLAPGATWFVSHPPGTHAVVPVLGASLSWLVGSGPRLGVRAGGQWLLSDGTLPRWSIPVGLTVEFP